MSEHSIKPESGVDPKPEEEAPRRISVEVSAGAEESGLDILPGTEDGVTTQDGRMTTAEHEEDFEEEGQGHGNVNGSEEDEDYSSAEESQVSSLRPSATAVTTDEAGCGKGSDSEEEECRKIEAKRLRAIRIRNKASAEKESKAGPGAHVEESKPKLVLPCDMENECRIRPRFTEKFRPGDVQRVIEQVMRDVLTDKEFDATLVEEWITEMAKRITDQVEEFAFPRYKIITEVTIVELRGQSAALASRCLWDSNTDSSASFTLTSETMTACGMVFGLYHY